MGSPSLSHMWSSLGLCIASLFSFSPNSWTLPLYLHTPLPLDTFSLHLFINLSCVSQQTYSKLPLAFPWQLVCLFNKQKTCLLIFFPGPWGRTKVFLLPLTFPVHFLTLLLKANSMLFFPKAHDRVRGAEITWGLHLFSVCFLKECRFPGLCWVIFFLFYFGG